MLPPDGTEHVATLRMALAGLEEQAERISHLGERLAACLLRGGRLIAAGNGGSAAQAQHLTAELVGRYHGERQPLSALCLHGDTSSLTAIANDYGYEHAFARQVVAHGRPGDILLVISTSGTSENILAAARAGAQAGLEVWALTGSGPTPLRDLAHEAIALPAASTATVQELHTVALHMVCAAVDREVALHSSASERARVRRNGAKEAVTQ
jgi:D-sedoheptulose 7-phosphate isomerase